MTNHLYLIHTPLQLWVAELIDQSNFGNHHLFLHDAVKGTPYNKDLFKTTTLLEYSPNWKGSGKQIDEAYKLIAEHVDEDTHIYFSDIRWALNNRVFFGNKTAKKATFHIIDEGVGIYLNYPITTGMWLKSAIKSGMGAKGFTPYTGHLKGITHPRIRDIYAFHPEWIETKKPLKRIQKPALSKEPAAESLLFLEQRYGSLKPSTPDWESFMEPILEKLNDTPNKFVKAHHMIEGGTKFFAEKGYASLQTPLAVEKYITENPFGIVASVNSSALLNIKAFFPEIRCISVGLDEMANRGYVDKRRYDSFVSLFEAANVERW